MSNIIKIENHHEGKETYVFNYKGKTFVHNGCQFTDVKTIFNNKLIHGIDPLALEDILSCVKQLDGRETSIENILSIPKVGIETVLNMIEVTGFDEDEVVKTFITKTGIAMLPMDIVSKYYNKEILNKIINHPESKTRYITNYIENILLILEMKANIDLDANDQEFKKLCLHYCKKIMDEYDVVRYSGTSSFLYNSNLFYGPEVTDVIVSYISNFDKNNFSNLFICKTDCYLKAAVEYLVNNNSFHKNLTRAILSAKGEDVEHSLEHTFDEKLFKQLFTRNFLTEKFVIDSFIEIIDKNTQEIGGKIILIRNVLNEYSLSFTSNLSEVLAENFKDIDVSEISKCEESLNSFNRLLMGPFNSLMMRLSSEKKKDILKYCNIDPYVLGRLTDDEINSLTAEEIVKAFSYMGGISNTIVENVLPKLNITRLIEFSKLYEGKVTSLCLTKLLKKLNFDELNTLWKKGRTKMIFTEVFSALINLCNDDSTYSENKHKVDFLIGLIKSGEVRVFLTYDRQITMAKEAYLEHGDFFKSLTCSIKISEDRPPLITEKLEGGGYKRVKKGYVVEEVGEVFGG